MAHINLLPWRDAERKRKQQEFLTLAGFTAVLGAIVVFFAHVHVNGMIDYQKSRNTYLENEIKLLEKKAEEIKELEATKKALLDRMEIIQQLQAARPGVVHLFDEMVTTLPEGMYLMSLTQKNGVVTVSGRAESKARVATYMRNLDASEWLKNPQLSVIETKDDSALRASDFSLTVDQTQPGAEDEATEAATSTPQAAAAKRGK